MRQATSIRLAPWQNLSRVTPSNILAAGPLNVYSFRELVQRNAEVVSLNPRYSIFYRGQTRQYLDRRGCVSILPSIYRGITTRQKEEMEARFKKLDNMVQSVQKVLKENSKFEGDYKLARAVNCWAIIQHYGLASTPLIDVSQSLRVACAFALQDDNDAFEGEGPVVYDIALPFATGPLTLDDNEALYLMKLDSLMPSFALRPFIQESYLVGDEFIGRGVGDIAGANLRRRVVASFRLCGDKETWHREIGLNANNLMIGDDGFSDLKCKINDVAEKHIRTGDGREEVIANVSEMLMRFAEIAKIAGDSHRGK